MTSTNDLERATGGLRFTTDPALDARILDDATTALDRSARERGEVRSAPFGPGRRRRRWGRLAAAAGLVLVIGVLFVLAERTGSVAYALEQTIDANRSLRSFHARSMVETEHGWESAEIWMQIDEGGRLVRLRQDLSHAEGGPKVVLWQAGKSEIWFKARDMVVVIEERDLPELVEQILAQVDPRRSMQFLHDARAAGRLEVRTIDPEDDGDPIRLVATAPGDATWMHLYLIDPETKLLRTEERHAHHEGALRLVHRTEYFHYNEPIEPGVFTFDLPAGVTVVDQTRREVGLAQGEQSDEEVALRVTREFLGAWVAGDLARAGMLMEGLPAERMPQTLEELFGAPECVGVVSIGAVGRDAEFADTGLLCVPCSVEVIKEGERLVVRRALGIRNVHNRSDRWTVAGTCDG